VLADRASVEAHKASVRAPRPELAPRSLPLPLPRRATRIGAERTSLDVETGDYLLLDPDADSDALEL